MKLRTLKAMCATFAAASLSLMASYAQNPVTGSTATGAASNPLSSAERAADLYGRQIVGSDNQNLGKVDNVIVDLESEHILYVVVSGSRAKVAVVPEVFGASSGKTLRVNIDKQKLDNAPQFTSDLEKPDQLGQASFVSRVYQYFGANPWWKGSGPVDQGSFHNVHKLNQLIGMNVEDVNNQNIGKISNVVVNMPSGRILYAVFEPASSLNLGSNLYAMPSDAFTLSSDQKHLVTGIDRQKLASAPHFTKNNWPNINDPTFASQVYQYYGKQAWFNGNQKYQPTGR